MKNLFRYNFGPFYTDLGLLVLRIAVGICLISEHALFKIPLLSQSSPQFPDPLGLGSRFSVMFAFLSDGICASLLLLGLVTRPAALIMLVNLTVAWGAVYGFKIEPANGELLALFVGGTLAVALMGPGRFSIDAKLNRHR